MNRAGLDPAEAIHTKRRFLPYVRSTTRVGQAWRQEICESGEIRNFLCPECQKVGHEIVVNFDSRVAGCSRCGWTPSHLKLRERAELDARDPELIPAREYMDRIEGWTPSFDKNLKKIGSSLFSVGNLRISILNP